MNSTTEGEPEPDPTTCEECGAWIPADSETDYHGSKCGQRAVQEDG